MPPKDKPSIFVHSEYSSRSFDAASVRRYRPQSLGAGASAVSSTNGTEPHATAPITAAPVNPLAPPNGAGAATGQGAAAVDAAADTSANANTNPNANANAKPKPKASANTRANARAKTKATARAPPSSKAPRRRRTRGAAAPSPPELEFHFEFFSSEIFIAEANEEEQAQANKAVQPRAPRRAEPVKAQRQEPVKPRKQEPVKPRRQPRPRGRPTRAEARARRRRKGSASPSPPSSSSEELDDGTEHKENKVEEQKHAAQHTEDDGVLRGFAAQNPLNVNYVSEPPPGCVAPHTLSVLHSSPTAEWAPGAETLPDTQAASEDMQLHSEQVAPTSPGISSSPPCEPVWSSPVALADIGIPESPELADFVPFESPHLSSSPQALDALDSLAPEPGTSARPRRTVEALRPPPLKLNLGAATMKRNAGMLSARTPDSAFYMKYLCMSPSPSTSQFRRRPAHLAANAYTTLDSPHFPTSPGMPFHQSSGLLSALAGFDDGDAFKNVLDRMSDQGFFSEPHLTPSSVSSLDLPPHALNDHLGVAETAPPLPDLAHSPFASSLQTSVYSTSDGFGDSGAYMSHDSEMDSGFHAQSQGAAQVFDAASSMRGLNDMHSAAPLPDVVSMDMQRSLYGVANPVPILSPSNDAPAYTRDFGMQLPEQFPVHESEHRYELPAAPMWPLYASSQHSAAAASSAGLGHEVPEFEPAAPGPAGLGIGPICAMPSPIVPTASLVPTASVMPIASVMPSASVVPSASVGGVGLPAIAAPRPVPASSLPADADKAPFDADLTESETSDTELTEAQLPKPGVPADEFEAKHCEPEPSEPAASAARPSKTAPSKTAPVNKALAGRKGKCAAPPYMRFLEAARDASAACDALEKSTQLILQLLSCNDYIRQFARLMAKLNTKRGTPKDWCVDMVWETVFDAPANLRHATAKDCPKCMYSSCIYSVLGFRNGADLAEHVATHHATQCSLTCEFCYRLFQRGITLARHKAEQHKEHLQAAQREPAQDLEDFVRSGFAVLPQTLLATVRAQRATRELATDDAAPDAEWTFEAGDSSSSDSESGGQSLGDSELDDVLRDAGDPLWAPPDAGRASGFAGACGSETETASHVDSDKDSDTSYETDSSIESDTSLEADCDADSDDSELHDVVSEVMRLYSEAELTEPHRRRPYKRAGRAAAAAKDKNGNAWAYATPADEQAYRNLREAGINARQLSPSLRDTLCAELRASTAMDAYLFTNKFGVRPLRDLLARSSRPAIASINVEDHDTLVQRSAVRSGSNSIRRAASSLQARPPAPNVEYTPTRPRSYATRLSGARVSGSG